MAKSNAAGTDPATLQEVVQTIAQSDETTREFLRQVRRCRARHAGDLSKMHQSLARINRPAASLRTITPAERFTEQVRAAVDGSVLRFSERRKLLRQAGRLGIDRFYANLIIATVQHQAGKVQMASPAISHRRLPATLIAVLLVQGSIALATWWMLR